VAFKAGDRLFVLLVDGLLPLDMGMLMLLLDLVDFHDGLIMFLLLFINLDLVHFVFVFEKFIVFGLLLEAF